MIENDVIIYDLTNQTSAAAGLVDCEITLYGPDFKQITSPRFALYVDDTLYSDSEVESKDEFTALVTAEKTAVSAAQSAKEAETNANESALLAEQYKNEAFKVTPAGFTEFVETTNDTLNDIGNLLGNTDISAIGDGTLTGGLDALNSKLHIKYKMVTCTVAPNSASPFGYYGRVSKADCALSDNEKIISVSGYNRDGYPVSVSYEAPSEELRITSNLPDEAYIHILYITL